MKNKFLYLLPAIILLVSCSKNGATEPQIEKATISISLVDMRGGTRALTHEIKINRIRVLMFRKDGANYILKQNEYFGSLSAGNKVLFNTLTGDYNIFYIANEPLDTDGTELPAYKNIGSEADIKTLQLAYATPSTTPYTPSEIAMFLSETNRTITTGTNAYSINVVRAMAKVYVDLIVKESDFTVVGEEVQITSVTLKGLPKYCHMVGAAYPLAGTFTDSEIQTVAPVSVSGEHTYNHVFYIPEYILAAGATQNATIEITGRSKTSGLECKWSEPLGDKMDNNVLHTKYDIRRNTEYQLIGRVKGYGDHEMFVTCKIEDWTKIDIEEELN